MSLSKIWEATERAGLGEPISDVYQEKLLRVQLDPGDEKAGTFDLFYFIHEPKGLSRGLKTVLFCAGGPGQIVRPSDENFLRFLRNENTAYRIVHFHLRGSGFSQFPPSNDFDRFLRTSYAVNDIEEIRKDVLKDEPWDAIVGYSYGTVLAQQYTARYEKEKKVRKLILIGALSMHKFKSVTSPAQAAQVFDEYTKAEGEVRQQVLMKILTSEENEEFKKLNSDDKTDLEIKLLQVFKQIEENFGSEQFIFEQYDKLKEKLRQVHLDHGPNFFKQIRELRMIGWQNPLVEGFPERQVEAARVIAVGLKPELKAKLGEIDSGEASAVNGSDESYRTHYVMQIYDGLRPRFVRALLAGDKQKVRNALKRSAGRVGINRFIEKVGVAKDKPKVWDPAEHKHGVPTLILKGEADPVTAVGQAEYYCEKALTGPRILLKLEGVGHGFHLPAIDLSEPFLIGSVRIQPKKINGGQAKEVSGFIYCEARIDDDPDEDGGRNDPLALMGRGSRGRRLEFEEAIILSEKKVSVLVRNLSSQRALTRDISLILRHPLFEGRVVLQSVGIPPKNVSWVKGTLEKTDKKPFVVKKPEDLDRRLRFDPDSAEFKPPDRLTLKIENVSGNAVNGKPRNWIYIPARGTEFFGPCQGVDLNARDALIYAFLEMEFEDFAKEKVQILGKIKPFLAGLWIHDGDKWKTRWPKDDKKVRPTNLIERPSTSIHAAVGPLS